MDTREAIQLASKHLYGLAGHVLEVLSLVKPKTSTAALHRVKTISKLSPLLGNEIEVVTTESLNELKVFQGLGEWVRQDPDFPDTQFRGRIRPEPGFEIKAWFPLSTEITARFRESQNRFTHDHIHVAMLAWIPEHLIYGQPHVLDVCIVSGKSVAEARDKHYHNPPDYLVLEPEDTTARTRNLQQTNTNGYKFQGTPQQFREAEKIVQSWGLSKKHYSATREYQKHLRLELLSRFPFRIDTNFAKMDRIAHVEIEAFKTTILATEVKGKSLGEWLALFGKASDDDITRALKDLLDI